MYAILLLFLMIYPLSCYMSTCYFTCYMLYFLWWHTAHVHVYSALLIFCFALSICSLCTTQDCGYIAYAHLHIHIAYAHLHVHFYHVTTSMFISITSPLDNSIEYINWLRLDDYRHDPNMTGSDCIKRWPTYICLLLTCLYISTASYILIIWYH